MKRIFRSPVLAGGIVTAALLAFLSPTAQSRVHAQLTLYPYPGGGYYNVYGFGPYGRSDWGYTASNRVSTQMYPSYGGMYGSRSYRSSLNRNRTSGYSNRFNYGIGPSVRSYGRSSYYQTSYSAVYFPFGY